MNGTWITDAELKDILLTLAKSGAPTPKKGTTLGDAMARFTTTPTSTRTTNGVGSRSVTTDSKCFLVRATVTKMQELVFVVDAESIEESIGFVGEYGKLVESEDSDYCCVETPSGKKQCRLGRADKEHVEITISGAAEIDLDDEWGSGDCDDND